MIEAALLAHFLVRERGRQAVAASLAVERKRFNDERDRDHAVRAARTEWLEEHDAERSFPCGVIRAEVAAPHLAREMPVIVAVLPDVLTFLVEPPERSDEVEPIEAGSIPRPAIGEIDVEDAEGATVPEPASESLDPEPDRYLVVRWPGDDGSTKEERLVFRSSWLAWEAARRLRAAATPAAGG